MDIVDSEGSVKFEHYKEVKLMEGHVCSMGFGRRRCLFLLYESHIRRATSLYVNALEL
jgi:hypothetical protein